MTSKSAQIQVTIDRTSIVFVLVGVVAGYYLTRKQYRWAGSRG